MHRNYYLLGWGYAITCTALVLNARWSRNADESGSSTSAAPTVAEAEWFRRVKPCCKPDEGPWLQNQPPRPGSAGGAAGKYVSPLAFPATFAVVAIIMLAMARETRREAIADPVAELPPGQARDLLLAVIVQSRPIFTAPSTTFDPAHETETRNNV